MLNEPLPYRSRGGGDRICPNDPDEGMSKTAKLDCESEDKQIRFDSPEGRIRADSRLVFLIYLHPTTSFPNWSHTALLQFNP